MKAIGLKERQAPNHGNLGHPIGGPIKQKSGAGLIWASTLSTLIKLAGWGVFIYVLLWCLNHFGILKRILWVTE